MKNPTNIPFSSGATPSSDHVKTQMMAWRTFLKIMVHPVVITSFLAALVSYFSKSEPLYFAVGIGLVVISLTMRVIELKLEG